MPTSPSFEPRLARVAVMVADPARSRMLAYLLSGECASAGELAEAASVTRATASGHLAKLLDGGLLVCEPRGRHRYYRLADPDVAHALEALAIVAERSPHDDAWRHPKAQMLRDARCCYGHLAGRLGVLLLQALQAQQVVRPATSGFVLAEPGRAWLRDRLAFEPPEPTSRRRFAYPCLDWSERRDHLAGQLADALYRHCVDRGWLERADGRAVRLTPRGTQQLLPVLRDACEADRSTRGGALAG